MSFGRITKLNVNIASCTTHITYANHSTRLLRNNPSGFVFRNMDSSSCPSHTESLSPATGFLYRHFGKRGSIRKTPSIREFLLSLGLCDIIENESEEQLETQAHEQKLQLHTCYLEQLPVSLPQYVSIIECPKEQLQMFNCGWHLQSCHWSNLNGTASCLPDCHCQQIKETMDYINELVNTSMPKPKPQRKPKVKSGARKSNMPDMNANIKNLNGQVQHLNNLLEQQNNQWNKQDNTAI